MTQFVQLLVLGMATGGYYTVNALGIVVVFRASGIINFASGGAALTAGYLEWQFADQWHLPRLVAVLGAIGTGALVSLLVYVLAIRPLSRASTLTQVIATLAVLVSIQQAILLIFGGLPKVPTAFLPTRSIRFAGISEGADSLITLLFAVALTFALWALYRRSRFGLATSALAESPMSLAALGWSIGGLRAANWAIGGALAGMAGVGLGPLLQLNTSNFTALLIPTLASAVIGGLRSFPLTLLGGLVIGAAQAEAGRYLTWNGSGDAVPFLLIIAVLFLRGRKLPLRNFVQERLPRVGSGHIPIIRLALLAVVIAALAMVVEEEWVIGATFTVLAAVILLSQVVITGYAGQLSLAQLTMGGVGAIVAARVSASFHTPFLLTLLVGMIAVIPAALLVGLPSLRARGVSLAIASLGFAVVIQSTVLLNNDLNGGAAGLTLESPTIFGFSVDAVLYPRRYFLVTVAVFIVLAAAVANLRRGRTGRRLLAVRNNERAAAALGINVTGAKLYAFTVAGVIAGAGGSLMVLAEALPQFNGFDPLTGLSNLVNSVLGGIGYLPGAVLGGLFANDGLPQAVLNPVVSHLSWWNNFFPLAVGVVVVLQLIQNPDGIADVLTSDQALIAKRGQLVASVSAESVEQVKPNRVRDALASFTPAGSRRMRVQRLQRRYLRDLQAAADKPRRTVGAQLKASNLTVRFGSVTALDDVSIEVHPGEVLAIIGPNGAGKTTLMDAITGFVETEGQIELNGSRIDGFPANRRARAGIARSFQSLELLEDMSVMDNLRCAADTQDAASLLLDFVRPERTGVSAATAAAITTFGLQDKLTAMPTEIGYGERRLVAIARAVAGEPALLLLDEPAAGLSETEREEVARIITMIAKEWQIAVLLIEHDVALVRRVADRVVALDFGRQIAQGSAEEVLASPEVVEASRCAPATDEWAGEPTGHGVLSVPPENGSAPGATASSIKDEVAAQPNGSAPGATASSIKDGVSKS